MLQNKTMWMVLFSFITPNTFVYITQIRILRFIKFKIIYNLQMNSSLTIFSPLFMLITKDKPWFEFTQHKLLCKHLTFPVFDVRENCGRGKLRMNDLIGDEFCWPYTMFFTMVRTEKIKTWIVFKHKQVCMLKSNLQKVIDYITWKNLFNVYIHI